MNLDVIKMNTYISGSVLFYYSHTAKKLVCKECNEMYHILKQIISVFCV